MVTEDLPRFNAAMNSALRGRDSVAVEGILLVLVYTFGLWVWRSHLALGEPTGTKFRQKICSISLWQGIVRLASIPIFSLSCCDGMCVSRIWFQLLWRISRLNLRLSADHPDRSGGIGFLGECSYAFGPILFAQGVLLSGLIASRVMYEGRSLLLS